MTSAMVRAIINHMLPVADQCIITQVTATALNKVYDVYVIDKPCGEKLVLKHDPSGYEGRVYQEVLTGNLPVAKCHDIYTNQQGAWLLLAYLGQATLTEGSLNQYCQAASAIARIHSQLSRIDTDFVRDSSISIEAHLQLIQSTKDLTDEAKAFIVMAGHRMLAAKPTVIHGDFLPINVIAGSQEIYILDWRTAALGCYAHDLGRLLGDLKDHNRERWLPPQWHQAILETYYQAQNFLDQPWQRFVADVQWATLWNYAEIVVAHLRNDWEQTPWYQANVSELISLGRELKN